MALAQLNRTAGVAHPYKLCATALLQLEKIKCQQSGSIHTNRSFSSSSGRLSASVGGAGGVQQQQKVVASKPSFLNVFDRDTKMLQRRRALQAENSSMYDYLKDEVRIYRFLILNNMM